MAGEAPSVRPWRLIGQGGAALAGGMGVGRFAYTPILPLMQAQAGLSPRLGATLATANYVGYLAGALAAIVAPRVARSRLALRLSLLILAGTLALMPTTHSSALWVTFRLVAGVASALIFVIAVSTVLTSLHHHHQVGWTIGGVGAGIAVSGAVLLVLRTTGTWRQAWWTTAVLTLACTLLAWRMPGAAAPAATTRPDQPARSRWFAALLTSYSLEGVGYIIAGTFLVAAIDQTASEGAGSRAWVVVGLAALPSSALWAWLGRIWSRPAPLFTVLTLQSAGIALPVIFGGAGPAFASAFLFGATFLGVASITLALGTQLRVRHAVAILTTGYSIGQIIGPLAVGPLLHNGYHQALLISAGVVALAAIASSPLTRRLP